MSGMTTAPLEIQHQGLPLTVFKIVLECEKSHLVTREWFWCALTRSTDVNNVLFYESAEGEMN